MILQKKSERQFHQLSSQKTGENYSLSSVISEVFKSEDLFLSIERVRAKSRSSGAHFHTDTDEMIHVLSGNLLAIEGENEVEIGEGDSLFFKKQSGFPHFLRNDSEMEAQVLVIRRKTDLPDTVMDPSKP